VNESQIFVDALKLADPAARAAFLDATCAGNPALRVAVEALLKAEKDDPEFLEKPAASFSGTIVPPSQAPTGAAQSEIAGTVIGPYKLVEQIGEGGMGTVWMAEQTEPVKRLVAVKLIKAGMDSKQVIARFEAERQALALMDHPNIARVLDAGTTDAGRPYFVMDLVKGVPITKYCDEHRLTPQQRLELFVPVCHAVQHAHQKGIIHRDLKPSNVLVVLYDGRPVPKIIDFGVAKAAGPQLTEKTLVTGFGSIVGTLEYMSPEQAEVNQLDIDTRSDIYSLGVLLYELLTGSPPFTEKDLEKAGMLEMLRVIREQEPSKPSTKLSSSEALPTLSANRSTEPAKLTKLVRGDLDWIVMKALEKDRNRRYETANGFAMDVQRYLADEPVLACPPSARYRLKKLVRRNKGPVLATALVFLALVAGVIGTTIGLFRAEKARQATDQARFAETQRAVEAQTRLAQVERGAEIMASVFQNVSPEAEDTEGVTLRVLLGRRLAEAAQKLEGETVGDPLIVARLQHLLGSSLGELGHAEQAEQSLIRALRTRERLLGTDDPDTLATKQSLGLVYWDEAKYPQAETLFKDVIEVRVSRLGPNHADTLSAKNSLGLVYASQRKLGPAETFLGDATKGRTALLGPDAPETLRSKNNLAGVYRKKGENARAETLLSEVVAAASTKLRPNHPHLLRYKNNLADFYESQKKYEQAETLLVGVVAGSVTELGPAHQLTLLAKNNLAAVYIRQDKYAQAEEMLKAVLDVQTATLAPDHAHTLTTKNNLAAVYGRQGKNAQAEELIKAVIKVRTAKLGAGAVETLASKSVLAHMYTKLDRDEEAETVWAEMVSAAKERLQLSHPDTQRYIDALAEVHEKRGQPAASEVNLRELADHVRKTAGPDVPAYANRLAQLARNLVLQRKYSQAESISREGLTIHREKHPMDWNTIHLQSLLGAALLGQQQYAKAEGHLVAGYQGMKKLVDDPARKSSRRWDKFYRAETLEWLVQLYEATSKPDEAAKWRKELKQTKEKP
jgi:serine/threonine protein kinase/tetratricopeptide (TPR) repeat protein